MEVESFLLLGRGCQLLRIWLRICGDLRAGGRWLENTALWPNSELHVQPEHLDEDGSAIPVVARMVDELQAA